MDTPRTEERTKQRGGITGKGWLPGQSGNPGGRPKKLPITEALQEILDDPVRARAYAVAGIKHAMRGGSASHFKEINDRVEGKVADQVEHSGGISITVEHITGLDEDSPPAEAK